MKRQEIPYRMPDGSTNWLQPGSQAHQLHTEGKTKQLAMLQGMVRKKVLR